MLFVMIMHPATDTVAIGLREWLLIIAASTLPILLAGGIDSLRRMGRAVQKG
jgi:hypothetical protein